MTKRKKRGGKERRVVTALAKTIEIQTEIDAVYSRVEEAAMRFG